MGLWVWVGVKRKEKGWVEFTESELERNNEWSWSV
jgi:hypothetical protein